MGRARRARRSIPTIKRLAMHVEDHPFDYGEFEGVIPSGYGAGIVMLWDQGTWTPEVDDVDAALKKGDLKFTLDGYKLKGSWVLVRTSGRLCGRRRSGGRSVAAHQAQGRLGRRRRHRGVRAAQREERRRLRGHPRPGQPRHLAVEPPRQGRRDRQDVRAIIKRALELKTERESKSAAPAKVARTTATKKKTAAPKKPAKPAAKRAKD